MSESGRIYFIRQSADDTSTLQIDVSADIPLDDLVTEFRGFLLAIGYHPETVATRLGEEE